MTTAISRMDKAELRKIALARRSALAAGDRRSLSVAATGHMAKLIGHGETVALFLPIRDEIDAGLLFQAVREKGGRILLPAIEDRKLEFRFFDPGDALVDGGFGTRQPAVAAAQGRPDFIVAPMAAYDATGNRIGYGAGYYDGATNRLDAAGHPFRYCGLAFACQMVDAIPAEAHDRRLDAVVTENGVTWFQEQS